MALKANPIDRFVKLDDQQISISEIRQHLRTILHKQDGVSYVTCDGTTVTLHIESGNDYKQIRRNVDVYLEDPVVRQQVAEMSRR